MINEQTKTDMTTTIEQTEILVNLAKLADDIDKLAKESRVLSGNAKNLADSEYQDGKSRAFTSAARWIKEELIKA